jgi:hypothetical protein
MDFSDFIPMIAAHLNLAPATLVFLIFCINQFAKIGGRLIPNDATGVWAIARKLCGIIGADPSSRVTSGVSVQDVAQQALATPPITEKVAAATGTDPVADPVASPTA